MAKRLAITIAGAVSLGAYEAGVLYEIVEALRQHNEHPDTKQNGEQIYIDVLTGASAGGMTAVIAAQKLLYEGKSLEPVESNPFFDSWVADISLDRLLDLSRDEIEHKTGHSIFSSDLVETLGNRYLLQRYAKVPTPARQRHPAAAEKIFLGLALSNLNGVSYSREIRTGMEEKGKGSSIFSYGRFQDEKVGVFAADGSEDSLEGWKQWKEAAVACGAFPFAFRVKELHRDRAEYTRPHLDPWGSDLHRDFAYTDGGVFQNQPLGLAKDLVDQIDRPAHGAILDTDSRFYLFVSPDAKTNGLDLDFKAAKATFLPFAKALVGAILHQAQFQDWVNAEEINSQLNVFNIGAHELLVALQRNDVDAAGLHSVATQLLARLPSNPPDAKGIRAESLDDARTRLRQQFGKELKKAAPSEDVERAWVDAVLVLETVAGLKFKDEMNIYGITADNTELAGAGLFSFEGFFDLRLRSHDYNLGRKKAQKFLLDRQAAAPRALDENVQMPPDIGPIRCSLTAVPPIEVPRDPNTNEIMMSALDPDVRKKMYNTLGARAEALLVELKVPWLVRKGIRAFLVNPQLRRRLAL
jgi:predicted acylesterase/phospholipase RssA